jgi:hypothetical protein
MASPKFLVQNLISGTLMHLYSMSFIDGTLMTNAAKNLDISVGIFG